MIRRLCILCFWLAAATLLPPDAEAGIRVWHPLGFDRADGAGHRYFAVEADAYGFVYDLGRPGMTELYNRAQQPASGPNLIVTESGVPGAYIQFVDGGGKTYCSYRSDGNSTTTYSKGENGHYNSFQVKQTRMSFRQAGPAYYQLDVVGIRLRAADGSYAPITVSQRYHLWPEKYYVETTHQITGDTSVLFLENVTRYSASYFSRLFCADQGTVTPSPGYIHYLSIGDPYGGVYDTSGGSGAVAQEYINRSGTDSVVVSCGSYGSGTQTLNHIQRYYDKDIRGGTGSWLQGQTYRGYCQWFFSKLPGDVVDDAAAEISPAVVTKVTSSSGMSSSVPYDNKTGVYKVQMPSDYLSAGWSGYDDYADLYQNHYETARLRIANTSPARNIRIRMVRGANTGVSPVWGEMVVSDAAGFPLGVASQQGSRWSGRDDRDTFFTCVTSVPIAANETKDIQLNLVFQNWGKKPIIRMQCQDLYDFDSDPYEQQWMQSSIGQGENMCYYVQRSSTIEDVRPLNGRMLDPSSPTNTWRSNCGGWEFLKLWGNTRLESLGLVYRRAGVNLFDFDLTGAMADGSITSTVRVIAFPADDVTRTFFKVRYDVKKNIYVGAIPSNLRLFSLGDESYLMMTYPYVAYTNASGGIVNQSSFAFSNRPIGGPAPWACVYGASSTYGFEGNRGFVLRDYAARVNGVTNNSPAITLTANASNLVLTPHTTATSLKAGDYFDFEIDAVAFGTPASDYSSMVTEAQAFGPGAPSVPSVYHGTLAVDWPARVDIGPNGYADFTISGGRDVIPVEIGGFASSQRDLRVEELLGSTWVAVDQSVTGRDIWQTHHDATTGGYSFLLALHTDGSLRRLRVSQTLNLIEAEDFASKSADLVSVPFPGHIGGSYVAAEGDSPIGSGQWLHYGLSNQSGESKRFTPYLRYAAIGDSLVHLEINGVNQTGPVVLPDTTSPNVWKALSLPDVTLSGGSNVLKLVFDDGACYVDSIGFRLERPVAALADDAALVNEDVVYNLNSAVPTVNTITMRNTGASTWTADGGYGLACGNELDSTTWYPVSAAVPPGGEYTFRFIGPTSPATVKLFLPEWQMKRQSTGYFGTQVSRPQRSTDFVQVTSSAKLVSDDIPVRLGSRESAQIHVTVRNVGIGAWNGVDASDYSGLYLADAVFGTANTGPRVSSGEQVAPGGDRTFRVVIKGPESPGVYTLRMRMFRNGYGFFGPYIVRQIEVVTDASPPAAPTVTDDGAYTTSLTRLHAAWTASSDMQSGIVGHLYAVGMSPADPGTGYIVGWTAIGPDMAVTRNDLHLVSGVTYYFYVKAQNGAGMWSVAGVSDGILVVDRTADSPGEAKLSPDDTIIGLHGVVVTATAGQMLDRIYVEKYDLSSGLAVQTTAALAEGDLVEVAGRMLTTVDGERMLADATVDMLSHGAPLQPLSMNLGKSASRSFFYNAAAGAGQRGVTDPPGLWTSTVGLLVRVTGLVMDVSSDSTLIFINDGSWPLLTGARVERRNLPALSEWDYVEITGISSMRRAGTAYQLFIRPRKLSDTVIVAQ